MKFSKTFLAALAILGLSSCNDDEGENYYTYIYSFEVEDASTTYNEQNYWTDVYNEDYTVLGIQPGAYFTHTANAAWQSWTGFCPSRATETQDVSGESTLAHQWSSATGSGANNSADYILAFWSSYSEDLTSEPKKPSCQIAFAGNATPLYVYVANSNYSYWAMKNGTSFNKAFGSDDWCKVIFHGVRQTTENGSTVSTSTGEVECYLAKNGEISRTWQSVDLTSLGTVTYIYMTMESSDTGEWGMNNPAYFCLDNLAVRYNY